MVMSENSGTPEAASYAVDVVVIASFGESLVKFRGDLLRQMVARKLRVLAIAPEMSEHVKTWLARERIDWAEAPLSRNGTDWRADARFFLWLCAQVRRAKPAVVLAYTAKPVVYGMLAARLAGARAYALITGLGYAFTEGAGDRYRIRKVLELLYRVSLLCADGVFFQNQDDQQFFRTRGLLRPNVPSFIVAGSGVDVVTFSPVALPEGPCVFLMIARLLGDKGIREYVDAARDIRRRHPEVRFMLVGWVDSNPDAILHAELNGWIADGTIEFLGKLDDVRPAIAASTVYVLPSYREGTPRTVLEAMAMARPIITTDAPGCRETVEHGENGFLVPVRSSTALAAAMETFIQSPQLAKEMGNRSRARAVTKYDSRVVSASMLDTMRLVVG